MKVTITIETSRGTTTVERTPVVTLESAVGFARERREQESAHALLKEAYESADAALGREP